MNNLSNHYQLKCVQCNSIFEDTDGNFLLNCSNEHPSLLRTLYSSEQLNIKPELPGILRYRDWLPVRRSIKKATAPAVFLSKELGHHLKLNNLYILFNGYWPEKGAFMESCTFKELEAPGVCCRIGAEEKKTLVVASAGNTGRAFIQFCSDNNIPALIVVPHAGIKSLWGDLEKWVKDKIDFLFAWLPDSAKEFLGLTMSGLAVPGPTGGASGSWTPPATPGANWPTAAPGVPLINQNRLDGEIVVRVKGPPGTRIEKISQSGDTGIDVSGGLILDGLF